MPSKPKKDESFKEHVLDQLSGVRGLTSRSMFGGWGFYTEGTFFGLIADGRLYFFVDDVTRPRYTAEGMTPFSYSRDGKDMTMSYFEVPEAVLDRSDELAAWATQAAVAKRASSTRKKK